MAGFPPKLGNKMRMHENVVELLRIQLFEGGKHGLLSVDEIARRRISAGPHRHKHWGNFSNFAADPVNSEVISSDHVRSMLLGQTRSRAEAVSRFPAAGFSVSDVEPCGRLRQSCRQQNGGDSRGDGTVLAGPLHVQSGS